MIHSQCWPESTCCVCTSKRVRWKCMMSSLDEHSSSCPLPASIKKDDLYPGNEIVLHSRTLKIIRYADLATEKNLTKALVRSTCILTHNCLKNGELGSAISVIEGTGLKIIKL